MRTLHSPLARQIAATWIATLLILSGVGLISAGLDATARQQLNEVVRALALSPADYNAADPLPAFDSPAPLRTY